MIKNMMYIQYNNTQIMTTTIYTNIKQKSKIIYIILFIRIQI